MPITKATASSIAPAAKGDLVVGSATNDASVLAVGSANQVLTVDSSTATGLKWATPSAGAMTQIADTTVTGSTAADITFSSISGSYNHLMVVISGRTSSAGENGTSLSVQVNGDTGTNYRFSRNVTYASSGTGVTVTSGDTQSALRLGNLWVGKVSGDYMANAQMIFPDYKSTTLRKTMLFSGGAFSDAPGVGMGFAQWQNTNAITSIKIFSTSNFDIGTRATLYGLV